MSIESHFDIPLIAAMALREKQIQQNYRPIIGIHKWFARRPGTLFRGLLLAEFGNGPLDETFFLSNDLSGISIADPFMGGGTTIVEANRVGCDVQGFDINPMAAWIVREEIEDLDVEEYKDTAHRIIADLGCEVGAYYRTNCPLYGDEDVPVKSFLWVKTINCEQCKELCDLFPRYLLASDRRHPKYVLVCPSCGELNEVHSLERLGGCSACGAALQVQGPAKRGRCKCLNCHHTNNYPRPSDGPLEHRLFAIEYFNPCRKPAHRGRFFKKPDQRDLANYATSVQQWKECKAHFVPDDKILPGDETTRLYRWGYRRYRDLFNPRQLLGIEMSCRLVNSIGDQRLRRAMATNLSDLLRYQNMLCRYDAMTLKALDIFSVHGFPVGLVQCEANLLGITNGSSASVGSGGWSNIIAKYAKAKGFCEAPYEVARDGRKNVRVYVRGERIGHRNGAVTITCEDAAVTSIAPQSLDAVLTDPPYLGNVQYGELMDFCYVWLRRLAGSRENGFDRCSTRARGELTANATENRGIVEFTEGLSKVYSRMAVALKPGSPLAFTYHHNKMEAYHAVAVAILDSGLTCSASLPCPAEMSGSIHIHGTKSSIVDTIFVCRSTGEVPKRWLAGTINEMVAIVSEDMKQLGTTGHSLTLGDIRCIVFGHMTRMATWLLRQNWDKKIPTETKLEMVKHATNVYKDPDLIVRRALSRDIESAPMIALDHGLQEPSSENSHAVSF